MVGGFALQLLAPQGGGLQVFKAWLEREHPGYGSDEGPARFRNATGQVKTVNMNGRALVEFDQWDNIGWYDIELDFLKVVPKPEPKPEPPPEPKPEPKPAPPPPPPPQAPDIALKAKAEAERKRKEEAERKEAEAKKQEEKKQAELRERQQREVAAMRAQAERETQSRVQADREAQLRAQAERESRDRATLAAQATRGRSEAEWIDRIRAKIRSNVILPPDLAGNPEAIFDVVQLPTGEVLEVQLRKSSGVRAYDDAVQRAILKSSPLPKPAQPELFVRTLQLRFRPFD